MKPHQLLGPLLFFEWAKRAHVGGHIGPLARTTPRTSHSRLSLGTNGRGDDKGGVMSGDVGRGGAWMLGKWKNWLEEGGRGLWKCS